ncbi:unnamed protein product [Durusdinium trenchii]|uniref:Nuclear pore complex protein Nup85 n=1 Tax=Durusdinium trenchii TaxID=1381693 RepID=A0ABP0IB42_9DINO
MRWWWIVLSGQALRCRSVRQAPDGAEVVSACFFAYVLKLDMPGSNHHTIRASDFQRKAAGFYEDSGLPPPLLEAYWILALPEHFQEAVLKECPAMVVLAYLLGAESKLYTEPQVAAELYDVGMGLLQRFEIRTRSLIRESWPIDAALGRLRAAHESLQRLGSKSVPSTGLVDIVLAYCNEDLQWLQVALPRWVEGTARLYVYEKCGTPAVLGLLPAHIQVFHEQVIDGPPGGRKDECSAYLTHLSRAAMTRDVALYTLFLQADALNHVWPYYLHLVMRSIQLRSLDVSFLHLGQSRMVASTSECKRAIFKQVMGVDQQKMASGYCCAQFLVRQDLILAQGELWFRALKAMDEPLPAGCEHVRCQLVHS